MPMPRLSANGHELRLAKCGFRAAYMLIGLATKQPSRVGRTGHLINCYRFPKLQVRGGMGPAVIVHSR